MARIGASFYNRDYFIGASKSAYEDYTLCSGVMRSLADMIVEHYGSSVRVLDIGCAYGYLVGYLRERGVDAYGVDISDYAIARASPDVRPCLSVANLLALPFADRTFDLVFSSECLEHVYEDEAVPALSEVFRICAGRACLLIGLNEGMEDRDKGHVNLKAREWWEGALQDLPDVRRDEAAHAFFNEHSHSAYMSWANRFFCLRLDKPGRNGMDASFFDKEYFDGEGKISSYKGYTEEGMAGIFPPLAELLTTTFSPKTVLDCGCAKGYLVKAFRQCRVRACGQDISGYAISQAPADAKPFLVASSITELQFGNESFDLLVSTDTMEHLTLAQIDSTLAEMKRVGKRWFFFTICLNLEPCPDDLIVTDPNDKSHITIANRNFWNKRLLMLGLTHRADVEAELNNAELCQIMKWNIFVFEKRKLRHKIADSIAMVRQRATWPRLKGRVRWLFGMLRGAIR